uniref:Lactamase_B domain-containing protein n=1 Tax=Caenorhabditis tropicalis TaxID=1561998 RepID=A0A1I7TJW7_9PELO
MVYDGGHYIVVDSPSATDVHSKELMLKGISSRNIVPGEIQYVVTTHGHPDHFGQGNFFPNARHFFGSYEYSDTNFISTELHTKDIMQLTANVQLWNTPGHTAQDVTVMVHNVSCCGIIAVAEDANEAAGIWFQEAWNPIIGKISRNKVICYADYVIPGHGKLFRITQDMKTAADCFTKYETEGQTAESIPQFENSLEQVLRKPAETLFSSANSLSANYVQDPTTTPSTTTSSATPSTSSDPSSDSTTTSMFYTVDLTAETPSTSESDLIFDTQENLPPLGIKIKKNINYIELPDLSGDINPMVQNFAKKVSEVLKQPQNDTEIAKMMPHFKKWQTTLTKLW